MPNEDPYDRYLEKRAEELGLPTDPAAYQDGGLVPAGTADNLAQADALASLLRASDIPAWVNAPLATLLGGAAPMFSVLVPLGRLADAQRFIAEHPHQEAPPEEEEETPDKPASEEPEAAPEPPASSRSGARMAAALIILVAGFGGLAYTVAGIASASGLSLLDWVKLAVCGALSILVCAFGIRGLLRSPEPEP